MKYYIWLTDAEVSVTDGVNRINVTTILIPGCRMHLASLCVNYSKLICRTEVSFVG